MLVPPLEIKCDSHVESSGSYKHDTRRLERQTFDFELRGSRVNDL